MKDIIKYLYFYLTMNEIEVKRIRRKYFVPNFGKCLINILKNKK